MVYPVSPPLLELLVLSMVSREDSYGYQISRQMKRVTEMKDSALYPVLRRLADGGFVEVYDRQFQGRNRKYYRITQAGRQEAERLRQEWDAHVDAVRGILDGAGEKEDGNEAENERERGTE